MNPNNLALLLGLSVIAALGLRFVNKRPPPNPEPEPEITVQSAGATVPAVVRPPARPPARPLARPRIPAPAMVPLTNQTEAVTAPTGGWLEKLLDRLVGGDETMILVLQVFLVVLGVVVANFILRRILARLEARTLATSTPWDNALVSAARQPLTVVAWVVWKPAARRQS